MILRMRFFRKFARRIVLFGYIGPIVSRTILKYDNNNTRMTDCFLLSFEYFAYEYFL